MSTPLLDLESGRAREWPSATGPLWAHHNGTDEPAPAWLCEIAPL